MASGRKRGAPALGGSSGEVHNREPHRGTDNPLIMPAVPPKVIVDSILGAASASGGSAVFLSSSLVGHPRKFGYEWNGPSGTMWVYIWTITHGGRPSLPDEFRIQLTSVSSPLNLNPAGLTLLLGYYPDLGVFGGFDLNRHQAFTGDSPSVQIDLSCLRNAEIDGIAFDTKDNDEIAVAFRPEFFLHYAANAHAFHGFGATPGNLDVLNNVNSPYEEPEAGEPIDAPSGGIEPRKLLVRKTRILARSEKFRRAVTCAYEKKCAITGLQLKLIDAAHILPVAAPGSADIVRNGLCLQPTFHRAYDRSLLFVTPDYKVKLNCEVSDQLVRDGLGGGLTHMESYEGKRILLPPDVSQHPDPALIEQANRFRGIPGY